MIHFMPTPILIQYMNFLHHLQMDKGVKWAKESHADTIKLHLFAHTRLTVYR